MWSLSNLLFTLREEDERREEGMKEERVSKIKIKWWQEKWKVLDDKGWELTGIINIIITNIPLFLPPGKQCRLFSISTTKLHWVEPELCKTNISSLSQVCQTDNPLCAMQRVPRSSLSSTGTDRRPAWTISYSPLLCLQFVAHLPSSPCSLFSSPWHAPAACLPLIHDSSLNQRTYKA